MTNQTEALFMHRAFPVEAADQLSGLLDRFERRKLVYSFPVELPEGFMLPDGVQQSAQFAQEHGLTVNTAIVKRYRACDAYRSAAYKPHRDPARFATQRLVLVTLCGYADLTINSPDGSMATYPCQSGDVVIIDPGAIHSVTPPLNPNGVRDFLFLGFARAEADCYAMESSVST